MGIGLNKMQINSIVICINFINNSIHVCSLSAQPRHTSLIVNASTATRKTVRGLKLLYQLIDIPLIYTVHVDFQPSPEQWRPLKVLAHFK